MTKSVVPAQFVEPIVPEGVAETAAEVGQLRVQGRYRVGGVVQDGWDFSSPLLLAARVKRYLGKSGR